MSRRVRRLVFGLGNPGPEYEGTRHNIGFAVIEHLALREGLLFEPPTSLEEYPGPRAFQCARSHDPDYLLVRPETFMNRSGDLVGPLLEWSGAEPRELLCVFDDMDLSVAQLRIRPHGGAGGQNGVRSIIQSLGTDRFPRLRVGIGRPPTDAVRHVLGGFSDEESGAMDHAVAEAADAILFWLRSGDIHGCMTRFHNRWKENSPGP